MKDEASETPEKIVCEKCGAEMHIVVILIKWGWASQLRLGLGNAV